jgi:hypothetical protein
VNVVPVQPGGLAEARAGVNEEHGKLPVVLRTMANFSKQPLFLVDLEKADAAAALFLAAKFGQAVNVAHLACLAEQLAQSSHLTVDGRIAVATLAERSDQAVQRLLAKGAEPLVEEDLIDLAQEGPHILLVPSLVPQDWPVGGKQLGYGEGFDLLDQSIGAERVADVGGSCVGLVRGTLT